MASSGCPSSRARPAAGIAIWWLVRTILIPLSVHLPRRRICWSGASQEFLSGDRLLVAGETAAMLWCPLSAGQPNDGEFSNVATLSRDVLLRRLRLKTPQATRKRPHAVFLPVVQPSLITCESNIYRMLQQADQTLSSPGKRHTMPPMDRDRTLCRSVRGRHPGGKWYKVSLTARYALFSWGSNARKNNLLGFESWAGSGHCANRRRRMGEEDWVTITPLDGRHTTNRERRRAWRDAASS